MPSADDEDVKHTVIQRLADALNTGSQEIEQAYDTLPRNVRLVLRRHEYAASEQDPSRPVCNFVESGDFMKALNKYAFEESLFLLARLYDEAHVALYRATKSDKKRYELLGRNRRISLLECGRDLKSRNDAINDQILIEAVGYGNAEYKAVFKKVNEMSFDRLPELLKLTDALPGERHGSKTEEYAGIGGGGGSDIISASILGVLLESQEGVKKQMNTLVSTRTWATGSQGAKGAKIGEKREIKGHAGVVTRKDKVNDKEVIVGGTYRISRDTEATGRHLEHVPLTIDRACIVDREEKLEPQSVYLVLDQGESADVPIDEKAKLKDQFEAILAAAQVQTVISVDSGGSTFGKEARIDTIISVDTGGDVFGVDATGGTTPDQDYRVQKAIADMNKQLKQKHNLVTAVVAPGVDAPRDAPEKAARAGGKRYRLKDEDKRRILQLLKDYEMDGTNSKRFGKTTLALQARLNGKVGWTSLDLPEYVIDTWENPWNSFVYIRECMSDIILMPTEQLLKQIAPKEARNGAKTSPKLKHTTLNGVAPSSTATFDARPRSPGPLTEHRQTNTNQG